MSKIQGLNDALIKYFTSYSLIVFSLILSTTAFATILEKKCGRGFYIIEIYNGFNMSETYYKLYHKIKGHKKKLFFQTPPGVILSGACIKNKQKQDLLLFLENSTGNAAAEDRYGIFDPVTEKMLIKPISWEKGNAKKVEKIIGYYPPMPDENDKTFFYCYNTRTPYD